MAVRGSQVPPDHRSSRARSATSSARGGEQLEPSQTLGEIVDCNNFQDARKFLAHGGQKGRQRGILREGVYAINIALFNVITEDRVFTLDYAKSLEEWQHQLRQVNGFSPADHLRQDPTRSASSRSMKAPRCRRAS